MIFNKAFKIGLVVVISFVITSRLSLHLAQAATVSNLVDFNNTSDLTNLFNPSTGNTFTNIDNSGISNTGSINVPSGSSDIWTTKQSYSVSGAGDIYTFSAFFKIKENNGFGGLGFSNEATNEPSSVAIPVYTSTIAPATGIGVIFHGGGGYFVNNATDVKDLDWLSGGGSDLVLGNWYKMIFVVTAKGSNTYDLNLQIWNTDSNGNLGTLFTEQALNGVVNSDVGSSSTIHGYFSASARRMEKIDNFLIQLEGGASFVEAGLPVVLTDTVTSVDQISAVSGSNVTDEQGSAVTASGICWGTGHSPVVGGNCTNATPGIGHYSLNINSLSSNTTYYVRSFATNTAGTSYGSEYSFTTTSSSDSSSGSSSNNSSAPLCNDVKPVSAPDLFQINTSNNFAKIFFTPISNTSQFYISFSENKNAERHGTGLISLSKLGVQDFSINLLKPNTTYYFKVRGQNGCMPGDWSNIMEVKTNNSVFYRYFAFIEKRLADIAQ